MMKHTSGLKITAQFLMFVSGGVLCVASALAASPDRYCGKGKLTVSSGGLTGPLTITATSSISGTVKTFSCATDMPPPAITQSTVSGNVDIKCVGSNWILDSANCVVTPYCTPATKSVADGGMTGSFVITAPHTNAGGTETKNCTDFMNAAKAPSTITGTVTYKCDPTATWVLDSANCVEKAICGPGTPHVMAAGVSRMFTVSTASSLEGATETKACSSSTPLPTLPATLSGSMVLKCDASHSWVKDSDTCVIVP